MPVVKRVRSRGANTTVEAHAEVLFTPVGSVGRWTNRLSNSMTRYARDAAPTNKRPRWAHYGAPLKTTISSSTDYDPASLRVFSAIGSSSPHGYYVDQGTGVFNDSKPYEAKVLPPSAWRAPDVYIQGMMAGRRQASPVWIKGQKPQRFLETGMRRGFAQAHLLTHNVPTLGGLASDALNSFPDGTLGFLGNTASDGLFKASLEQWKTWRSEYWTAREQAVRSARSAERKAVRALQPKKPKKKKKPKPKPQPKTVAQKKNEAVAAFQKQNPNVSIQKRNSQGLVVISPATGKPILIPWSRLYALL